eukprot:759333-Prymnesium_polylepis.1
MLRRCIPGICQTRSQTGPLRAHSVATRIGSFANSDPTASRARRTAAHSDGRRVRGTSAASQRCVAGSVAGSSASAAVRCESSSRHAFESRRR